MKLKILTSYLFGFVDIVVEGYYIERFINLCVSKGIFLWNLKRSKSTILHARVGRKDFKRLREVCKKTKCKMQIKRKKGINFVAYKYKKRKVFACLLILILLTILSLSNFVWNIEVTGNETISKEEILEIVKSKGLNIGKWKYSISTKDIVNEIRLQRDDIAWVGISVRGTNVNIKIVEADLKPEIINEEEYCNIVAQKDAMILKINATNGTPLVKQGDVVKKGDVLIGGWMEGKYTGTRYLHAQGEIQAKVWYTNKQKIYLKQTKKEETGAIESKYSVKINNFKINFYKRLSKFKNYDTIEENKKLKLFSDFYLPIEIIKHTSKEYNNIEVIHDVEEAKNLALENARAELNNTIQNPENILNEKYVTYEDAEYVEVELTYEVQESIGTKEKIVF